MPFLDSLTGLLIPRHAPVAWKPSAPAPDVTYPEQPPETVEINGHAYTVEYGYGGVLAYHPVGAAPEVEVSTWVEGVGWT